MYREIIRVMCHDFLVNVMRKKWDSIFGLTWLIIVGFQVISIVKYYDPSYDARILVGSVTLMCSLVLNQILQNMPLRIPKAVYVCPVDAKGKVKYLCVQLVFKIVLISVMMLIVLKILLGEIFVVNDVVFNLMQLQMYFFFCLYLNLLNGVRALEGKEIDERGYRVRSDAEHAVTIWWTCLWVLEWSFFLTVDMWGISETATYIMWMIFFVSNLIITLKYVKTLLFEMCSYEKAYSPKPKQESVQYDLF